MSEVKNSKAYFNFTISEKYEAGCALKGWMAKSARNNGLSLSGAYVGFSHGIPYAYNLKITPGDETFLYESKKDIGSDGNVTIPLLLKKSEIRKLIILSETKGISLPIIRAYHKNGKLKIEFGVGKGKKNYDKRESIKKRESMRELKYSR